MLHDTPFVATGKRCQTCKKKTETRSKTHLIFFETFRVSIITTFDTVAFGQNVPKSIFTQVLE